jgi:hypothetical protein
VKGGGAVGRMRWWWWWGGAFAKCEAGSGFGAKIRNRAAGARFRACRVERQQRTVGRGEVVVCTR